ncbi:MAG: polysaccharide biosynthesis protein [Muribaculum sp.]|nr:polysaccharide biosynthesis protein [Muribaculaceae bacterium]MCM1080539.1 polysaccharide biosynthesis protein [Muribaculum sp.]
MKRKIINRLLERYVNAWTVLLCDTVTSLLSSVIVLMIAQMLSKSFGFTFALSWAACSTIFSAILFVALRTYRTIIRYSTFHDVAKVALAVLCKDILLGVAMLPFVNEVISLNQLLAMLAFDLMTSICALVGVRGCIMIAFDMIKRRYMKNSSKNRILIYTGKYNDKAVSLVTRLKNSSHYQMLGFLDYGTRLRGASLAGLPMYYFETEHNVEYLRDKLGLNGILFAYSNDVLEEQDRLIQYCQSCGLKTLIAPTIYELSDGKPLTNNSIRKIRIEDLLCRPEIKISMDEIKNNFAGKTILVTGAAGSIGSELCRQLATFGIKKLIMLDNAETPLHNVRLEFESKFPNLDFIPVIGDVRQEPRMNYIFSYFKPQVVFHAAAYKHVPLMEENPCEAVLVNVVGSRQIADKCVEYGVEQMVMVSTDKAVNPTNVMGCTKRLAEIYVQSLGLALQKGTVVGKTRFVTTRFGNVLGSNGSVIPRFTEQIENGGPVTVTHPEIERFFMTIPEACRLVMEAATMTTGNQIFVFDMGQPVKIRHLAEQMIRLAGFEVGTQEEAAQNSGVIAIEYCGLRPGEKLYEELLASEENTIPTDHSRIRIAKVREYAYDDAVATVERLNDLSRAVHIPDMVRLMKRTVPEFKSNNSPYEVFDKEIEAEIKKETTDENI